MRDNQSRKPGTNQKQRRKEKGRHKAQDTAGQAGQAVGNPFYNDGQWGQLKDTRAQEDNEPCMVLRSSGSLWFSFVCRDSYEH